MSGMSDRHDDGEFGSGRDAAEGEEIVPPPSAASSAAGGPVIAAESGISGVMPSAVARSLAAAANTLSDALPEDALTASITRLKSRQAELRNQKRDLAKSLKNAERKKKRLRTRARQLTDEDLVQVLMLRKQQRVDRQSVEVAPAASVASSSSAGGVSSGAASSSAARNSIVP